VFTFPIVRDSTLGDLPPVPVAVADIPLFVVTSALVAAGVRSAVWIVVPWALLVTAGLTVYATIATEACWGAVRMVAAAAGGIGAGMLVLLGRIPTERILIGPLGFRDARPARARRHVARMALQIVIFWGLFLGVIPAVLAWVEHRWQLHVPFALPLVIAGAVIFAWIVVGYVIAGSAVWNDVVRPVEERDLLAKFGAPYAEYCARVRCWVPRIPARTVGV